MTPPTLPSPRTEEQKQAIFDRRVARRARRVRRRWATNAFILFHISMVALWLMPYQWPIAQAAVPPEGGGIVRWYMITTGFEQTWQMFSPNPDNKDLSVTALVTLKNGQTQAWRFPRMRDMGYAQKYERERMRKFLEIADYHDSLWYGMARYAAQQCAVPGNPPVEVTLERTVRLLPPPGQPLPPYTRQEFYHMATGAGGQR